MTYSPTRVTSRDIYGVTVTCDCQHDIDTFDLEAHHSDNDGHVSTYCGTSENRVLSSQTFTLLLTFPEPVDIVPDIQRDERMIAC